jgi:hypothetical protein
MRRHSWTKGFSGQGAVITLVILTASIGFCLFECDHDGDHHIGSVDLCGAMLPATFAPALRIGLFGSGLAALTAGPRPVAMALGVPHPPPRLVSFR